MASNEDCNCVVPRKSAVPIASSGVAKPSKILRIGHNILQQGPSTLRGPKKAMIQLGEGDLHDRLGIWISTHPRIMKKSRVGFSIPEQKLIHEKARKYATIALDMLYKEVGHKFELVKTRILKGIPTSSGKMIHMNFEAKNLDNPHDPVQLFFAELIKIDGNDIIANYCCPFGPADSLPDKHRILYCLHCRNSHIYHPRVNGYHCGRECQTVSDVLNKGQKIFKLKVEAEDHNHGRSYGFMDVDQHAIYALQVYNEKKGTNFELVEGGCAGGALLGGEIKGVLVHLNFKANNKDDPDAPMTTFFAEVIVRRDVLCVDYCLPVYSLPGISNLRNCCSCRGANVLHPPGLGYITGWEQK